MTAPQDREAAARESEIRARLEAATPGPWLECCPDWPCAKVLDKRNKWRDDAAASWECLDMVRAALERTGLPMQGTPPMFYDDAIGQLVFILGRAAGCTTWGDIQRLVCEHEAGGSGEERSK